MFLELLCYLILSLLRGYSIIDLQLSLISKSLTTSPSMVYLVHSFLTINTWMVLIECPPVRGWHMVGEREIILENFLWSLSKFIDPSKLLGIKDPNWNISLFDDSLLTVFSECPVLTNSECLLLTNSECVALRDLFIMVSMEAYSTHTTDILIHWSVEGLSLQFFLLSYLGLTLGTLLSLMPYLNPFTNFKGAVIAIALLRFDWKSL